MPYIHINKETNEISLYSSVPAISDHEPNINIDDLYYRFSRQKLTEWETTEYKVLKVEMMRITRKRVKKL